MPSTAAKAKPRGSKGRRADSRPDRGTGNGTAPAVAPAAVPPEVELFRLFTEHSADILGLMDDQGRYVYVSSAIERVLGFPPSHYIGRHALEFLHPEDVASASQLLASTAKGGDARGLVRARHANGSWRWIEGAAVPVTTADGHRRLLTVGRDVTDRQVAGEARQAAEERLHRYKEIFLRSSDGIAAIDAQGRYVEQNLAHRSLLGYSDAELEGQTPALHLGEEAFRRIAAGLGATGRFRGEFVSTTKGGGQVPVELSAFSLTDEQGRVVGHVGVKRDVTERHRAEREQRRRLHQLQVLYELNAASAAAEQPQQVYEAAMDALCAALDTDRASVLLYDAAGVMRFRAWRGLGDAYRGAVEGHTPWRRDDPDPRPVLVPDVQADPALADYQELFQREGIRALAFLPLRDRGVLLGKLMVYHRAPHVFAEDELHVAQTIAGHVATAVARQAANQAQAEQRNLLQALLEGLRDPAWLKDLDGRYLMINPAGARVGGRSVAEFIGRTAREIFGPAAEAIGRHDRTVIASGGPLSTEDVLPVEGKPHTFLVKRSPFLDAQGRVVGVIGLARDITETKAAEERLRASEGRFRSIVGNIPGLVYRSELRPPWRLDYVSDGVLEHTGYSVEEFQQGRVAWTDLLHPEDVPAMVAAAEAALERRQPLTIEYRIVRRDGEIRWVHDRGQAALGPDGTPLFWEGVILDITERKRAEEGLRASEQRFRSLSACSPTGVFLAEPDGRVTYTNPSCQAICGFTAEEALEDGWVRFLHPEDAVWVAKEWRRVASEGASLEVEFRFANPRTGTRWASVRTAPVVGDDGRPWGHVGTVEDVTARKEAEAALRLQGRVLESMTEGVSLTDEDGIIRYTNPAEDRIFGYAPGELVGQRVTVQNAYPPEENERRVAEVIAQLRERGSWHGEWHNRRKDGTTFWTEAHITALDFGGKFHWICVQTDVTERRRAREERERLLLQLQLEQARLTALVDQMPSAVVIAEAPSGRLLFGNHHVQRVWRHPLRPGEDVAGYAQYRGFHADGRPYEPHEWPLARAIQGEVVVGEEVEHERGDGTRGWMRINAAPIRDGNDAIVAGVAVFDDITEIKGTEVALRDLTRQQAVVAELGQLALQSHDLQPLLDRATELMVESLGADYSCFVEVREDSFFLRGGSCWKAGWVGEWSAAPEARSLPGRVQSTGGPVVVDDFERSDILAPELLTAHGVRSSIMVPLRGVQGVQAMMGAHARRPDAFGPEEVRFLEAAANVVAAAMRRHEVEVALKAANERLQELDRLKTHFLNTAAHELRTPLTPITLQLEILKQTLPPEDPQRRNLAILDRNMQRLSVLVEDILDVSRLQGGRLTLHPLPLDLDRLVTDVAETFQEPARRAKVTLDLRLGKVGRITADPQRVGQVLFNLLSNAMKFTPSGGRVEVSTSLRGDDVLVQIRDSGAGLEPHQMLRLFQPFSQVHEAFARGSGTGLGLFISRGIVEQHGGTIWAESPGSGQGANFCFVLPLRGPPQRPDDDGAAAAGASPPPAA